MKHAIKHIHFVGIGGSGMSGIAEVLKNLDYTVSGSDIADNATTRRLQSLGITVHLGHAGKNVAGADAVVTSTAVHTDNPEVQAARDKHIPVVPRAVMLAELMRLRTGIAIAGTHGKTTTTSLVASILAEAGLDPTFVIGGRLNSAGANAKLGRGEHIVVEADESDASFLNLNPVMSVVTNIDADHMDTYGHDFGRLKQAFIDFLHRMPFYGVSMLCTDDPHVCAVADQVNCPVVSYGFNEAAEIRAINVRAQDTKMLFTVLRKEDDGRTSSMDIVLNAVGEHNVRNALAAIGIASELEVPDAAIQKALLEFNGVGRRFQHYGTLKTPAQAQFTLIDDYGHHPVEMQATLSAARAAYPGKRLVLAFQPHRYTRTRDCFDDFVKVIGIADVVLLSEIYAAGEAPIAAADGRALMHALRVAAKAEPIFIEAIADMPQAIVDHVKDHDIVICMGAGSIGAVPAKVVDMLNQNNAEKI